MPSSVSTCPHFLDCYMCVCEWEWISEWVFVCVCVLFVWVWQGGVGHVCGDEIISKCYFYQMNHKQLSGKKRAPQRWSSPCLVVADMWLYHASAGRLLHCLLCTSAASSNHSWNMHSVEITGVLTDQLVSSDNTVIQVCETASGHITWGVCVGVWWQIRVY